MNLLDVFPNLESVRSENLLPLLGKNYNIKIIENILGNIILYPRTIPSTKDEMLFWEILFSELIKNHPEQFYNKQLNKIVIPETLLQWCPDEEKLAWLFINSLLPDGIVNLSIKHTNDGTVSLLTYVRPMITTNTGKISISLKDRKYDLQIGSYVIIAASTRTVDIRFESEVATLFGKNQLLNEVSGGKLGLIVDARLRKNG